MEQFSSQFLQGYQENDFSKLSYEDKELGYLDTMRFDPDVKSPFSFDEEGSSEEIKFEFEDTTNKAFISQNLPQGSDVEIKIEPQEEPSVVLAASSEEPCVILAASSDEPAVILATGEQIPVKIHNTLTEECIEQESTDFSKGVLKGDPKMDVFAYLPKTFSRLCQRQKLVDKKVYKKGPGRKRNHELITSSEIKELILEYLRNGLTGLICNPSCKKRTDLLFTNFCRVLKKLPHFLMEQTSVKNQYKNSDPSSFLLSFIESFTSFLFGINDLDCNLAQTFGEFVIMYYPKCKANYIIKNLNEQGLSKDFALKLRELLEMRDRTTIKHWKNWAKASFVMRKILSLALQVLKETSFTQNTHPTPYLIGFIQELIG